MTRWRKHVSDLRAFKDLDIAIHNTQTYGAIHNTLHDTCSIGRCRYSNSEYWGPGIKSGEAVNGTRHEDLQALSFADSSLDIVLSTELFEHMPDPYQAHREVFRVLRPGGVHIFTVPFIRNEYEDKQLARRHDNGTVEHLQPPIFHGDPLQGWGILVYNIFAQQMVDKLCEVGYDVWVHNINAKGHGILGPGATVFEAVKPMA